jgi:hypothetical protein
MVARIQTSERPMGKKRSTYLAFAVISAAFALYALRLSPERFSTVDIGALILFGGGALVFLALAVMKGRETGPGSR